MRNPFFAVGLVMAGLMACGGGSGKLAHPDGAAKPGADAALALGDAGAGTGAGGWAGSAGSSAGGPGGAAGSDARVASGGAADVPAASGGTATDGPLAGGGTASPDAPGPMGGRLDAGGAGTGGAGSGGADAGNSSGPVDAEDDFRGGSLNFVATPPVSTPGQSSTLRWGEYAATSLTIDQGIGSVLGKTTVVVTPSQTTTYILTLNDSLRDKVTVTVTTAGFTGTGAMTTARTRHTATLLANGKVLIAGGTKTRNAEPLASAELYDPGTGTFSATGSMTMARSSHTATLLPNGQVLLVGGASTSAELYDPVTGTFTATGNLMSARSGHTATLLPDGTVLITGGGSANSPLSSAELYDPAAASFAATGNLTVGRTEHAAMLLSNGTVLVAGGNEPVKIIGRGYGLTSAELYDPSTGLFSATGGMAVKRAAPTLTLLPGGKVLVAGGQSGGEGTIATASLEIYDPAVRTFAATGNLIQARDHFTTTVLPSGTVLFAGGSEGGGSYRNFFASAELYDQGAGKCEATGAMAAPREFHSATLLTNGMVLVAGGVSTSVLASAELYQP